MKTETSKPYYMHIAGEIDGLSLDRLSYTDIDGSFRNLLQELDVNIVKDDHYEFPGGGLSMVYILSASHLAIHTWPESCFLHFDLITCSTKAYFEEFKKCLIKSYPNSQIKISNLEY